MRFAISHNEMPPRLKAGFLCYESQNNSLEILVNVSGKLYNTRMIQTWSKYDYLCTHCDALIEATVLDSFQPVSNITCTCGGSTALLSVSDATIHPTTTKEEQMEETTVIGSDALHSPAVEYNPNLLVTYKVIHGYSDPEYTTAKVTSLEWDLHNGRQAQKRVGVFESKVGTVKDIITEAYAESEDQDTLRAIAEALDIELIRDVQFTATIEVSGTYSYNVLESEWDADVESEVTDALFVDSNHGNIQVDDQEVMHVREC